MKMYRITMAAYHEFLSLTHKQKEEMGLDGRKKAVMVPDDQKDSC